MFVETVSPERLAMLVEHYRGALAPDFGCRPNPEWDDLSQEKRNRTIAATRLALLDLRSEHLRTGFDDRPPSPGFAGGTEGKECGC